MRKNNILLTTRANRLFDVHQLSYGMKQLDKAILDMIKSKTVPASPLTSGSFNNSSKHKLKIKINAMCKNNSVKNNKKNKIDFMKVIHTNLLKYNKTKDIINARIANNIMFDENYHYVAVFKDFLYWDDDGEFLKRFYNRYESPKKFQRIFNYYEHSFKTYKLYSIYYHLGDCYKVMIRLYKKKLVLLKELNEKSDSEENELNKADSQTISKNSETKKKYSNIFTSRLSITSNSGLISTSQTLSRMNAYEDYVNALHKEKKEKKKNEEPKLQLKKQVGIYNNRNPICNGSFEKESSLELQTIDSLLKTLNDGTKKDSKNTSRDSKDLFNTKFQGRAKERIPFQAFNLTQVNSSFKKSSKYKPKIKPSVNLNKGPKNGTNNTSSNKKNSHDNSNTNNLYKLSSFNTTSKDKTVPNKKLIIPINANLILKIYKNNNTNKLPFVKKKNSCKKNNIHPTSTTENTTNHSSKVNLHQRTKATVGLQKQKINNPKNIYKTPRERNQVEKKLFIRNTIYYNPPNTEQYVSLITEHNSRSNSKNKTFGTNILKKRKALIKYTSDTNSIASSRKKTYTQPHSLEKKIFMKNLTSFKNKMDIKKARIKLFENNNISLKTKVLK